MNRLEQPVDLLLTLRCNTYSAGDYKPDEPPAGTANRAMQQQIAQLKRQVAEAETQLRAAERVLLLMN
jgi:hypothetical protein